MRENTSRKAGSGLAGKKIIIASAILFLMAAGCNTAQQTGAPQPVSQNSEQASTPATAQAPAPSSGAMAPVTTPTKPVTSPAKPPVVQTKTVLMLGSNSALGQYLTASNSMALYYYSNDSQQTSNCFGSCAVNWPPYTIALGTHLAATRGINGKISYITRPDGTEQITYNDKPLYFWVKDIKAGDTTGNQLDGFFVAKP